MPAMLCLTVKSLDGKKIVSMINLSIEGVRIQGDKIQLEGVVTANNYFKVLKDGSIEAKSGKIAGWNMDINSLFSGPSFSTAECFLCTGSSDLNKMSIAGSGERSGWVLKAGSNFGVTREGALYANDVHLEGEITAIKGKIGAWELDNDGYLIGEAVVGSQVEQITISPAGVSGFYTNSQGVKEFVDVSWREILTAAKRWNE